MDRFESTTKRLFTAGRRFAYRFCDALSLGLGLPIDFMRNAHKLIGQKGNGSILRTIYYPPIQNGCFKAKDQVRLGEHIDWGTVTINSKDSVGGLQVKDPEGNFLPTNPIPGTVLVTVGLLLQRWTSDLLTGSDNRILIPKEENCRKAVRQAAIFFLNTDDDYTIKCLHGSEKYAPMLTSDFLSYKAAKATKLNQ